MDEPLKSLIVDELRKIIFEVAPDAVMVEKYGGIMVDMAPTTPGERCCGYFSSKNHLSLEFSKGFLLEDPEEILEGSGKFRRHVKLKSLYDLQEKRCAEFLTQVSKL